MKILHISKFYPPYKGGIEDVCYNIVSALKPSHVQKVICFNEGRHRDKTNIDGVEIIRAGIICKLFRQPISFSLYFILKKYINTFSPDIIHLHLPNPLACIYILRLLPNNIKLVLHWHSDIVAQKYLYLLFSYYERKILERADAILVTSPLYLQGSKPLMKYKEKVHVLPNAVSFEKMNLNDKDRALVKALKCTYNKPIVFFIGRHVPYKGIEYLVQSEKYISSECVILIAGEGPLTKSLKEMTNSKRIIFLGKIPDEEIKIYMSAADIFAFPSITKNEAFGVALAEAMYCKAVPITFTIKGSGVNWVNLNNVTGIEIENHSSEELGKAIDLLLNNNTLRNVYSANAFSRASELFDIDKIILKLEAIYKKC